MEAYVLGPHEGKVLPLIGSLKASAAQTGDSFEVIDYRGPLQPPPHIHRAREEAFFILDGTFTFTLGNDNVEAGPGSMVFIPRGIRDGGGRSGPAVHRPGRSRGVLRGARQGHGVRTDG